MPIKGKMTVIFFLLSIGVNLIFVYLYAVGNIHDLLPSVTSNILSSIIIFISVTMFFYLISGASNKGNIEEKLLDAELNRCKNELLDVSEILKGEQNRNNNLIEELDYLENTIEEHEKEILEMTPKMKYIINSTKEMLK